VKWFPVFLGLLVVVSLAAQEQAAETVEPLLPQSRASPPGSGSLNWDIDTIFDDISPGSPLETTPVYTPDDSQGNAESPSENQERPNLVRRQGVSFDGSYEFNMGFTPGWKVAPWYYPEDFSAEDRGFTWSPGAKMKVKFDVDAQISEIFRVMSSIYFEIPGLNLSLGDFFFDYSLYDRVFFRGGKFNQSWGVSPNFAFTNLLARVPDESYNRDPFILKFDVPLGIGGIQFLILSRVDIMGGETPGYRDVGYGAKFNLAFRWIDIDLGSFYQERMPLRGFLSFKTTIGNTEWYNEWLGAVDVYNRADISGGVNLGFFRDFFRNRFTVNGEVFYNSERNTLLYRPETSLTDSETYLFVDGLNIAMNMIWRLGGKGNPRLFFQTLYAPMQDSAQLVPGFKLNPWSHIEFYFGVPMGVGSKYGYYYTHTADPIIPHRPFSIIALVTLRGNVKIGQYSH